MKELFNKGRNKEESYKETEFNKESNKNNNNSRIKSNSTSLVEDNCNTDIGNFINRVIVESWRNKYVIKRYTIYS